MRPRRIAVTGASGQLGRALAALNRADWLILPVERERVDIRDWRAVRDEIAALGPDLVIHAAAATDVDRCEREPEYAFAVNAAGTRHVAQAAARVGAELVYVSTNYVFDGVAAEPFHEFDAPRPISVYGASKLAGEREAQAATPRCVVVRTAWLYAAHGRNFVSTMRRLMATQPVVRVVNDQFGNPTCASDLATAIARISDAHLPGTYHVVNGGAASWYDWARAIAEVDGSTAEIVPIPASEYRRAAMPPTNGALTSLVLDGLGVEMPDWRTALRHCLRP